MLRIFEYDIDKMTGIQVWLGYTRENEATQIRIDVSKYLEKYPGASAVLLVKNPIGDLYPATISVESGIIVWNVGSADTIVSGSGQIAVTVSGTNGEIVKSACIDTILRTSLDDGDAGEAPSVYHTWLDKMLDAASKTEQNALAAANASANATQSAVNAGKSEQNAKASANAAAEYVDTNMDARITARMDKTLSVEDGIADAKTVGEEIGLIKVDILDAQSNRNLYDKNAPTFQYGIGSANLDVQNNANNLMLLFEVEEGQTYTISGIRTGWNICYSFVESASEITVGSIASEKLFEGLLYIDAIRGYRTVTIAQGIKCIGLIYWRNGVDTYTDDKKRNALQIEVGETYTDYIPHEMYSKVIFDLREEIMRAANTAEKSRHKMYIKNVPLFARCSNGLYSDHPTWVSRQYEISALCVHGRYLYTGSHLGFKKWDIGIETAPVDVTQNLESNEYLQKNAYIDQWSINPWGTGGGERIPYKMEYYNGHIYAIARGGSGFVADDASERNPNTNVKGEAETEGTVGYFMVLDGDLNVLYKQAYYGANKTKVGYRKPSGFAIDKEHNRIYIACQLYGWMCYDISSPSVPVLLYAYSPLDETEVSSINGADLSSKCGPIEYQNGCVFDHGDSTYYAVAGYVDGIHVWDVTNISAPTEIKNDMITDTYGLFWAFRMHESAWNTTAHVFDVEVKYPYMYATIAPTTTYGNDENRISGLIVLDISNVDAPNYAYYPIASDDWNTYQNIGDVKPSHLLLTNDKILLNNGNMGIAVYDNSGAHPVYMGCIPSDGDEIYQMARTDDGRLVSGGNIAPFNFRINRGVF